MLSVLPLLIVTCSSNPPATTPTPAPTPTPTRGGTLTIGIPAKVTALNPWLVLGSQSTSYNAAVFMNRYITVMKESERKFQWVPGLAADFPTPLTREGNFWVSTVKLRDNVVWSDGEALDANDVAFTVKTILDLGIKAGNWTVFVNPEFVDRAEAVDNLTVKYYFKATDSAGNPQTPGLPIWQFGLAELPILAEHFWGPKVTALGTCTAGDDKCVSNRISNLEHADASAEPVAGPATLTEYQTDAFVGLKSNDTSFIRDSAVTEYGDGAVKETVQRQTDTWLKGSESGSATQVDLNIARTIDPATTIFSFYDNNAAGAVLALRAGEIDYFLSPLGLTAGLLANVRGDSSLSININPSNGFRYLAFNFDREPFDDPAFKKAFALLVDRDFLADSVLQGVVEPVFTVVPTANKFWHNPNVPQIGRKIDAMGNLELDSVGNPIPLNRPERIVEAVAVLKGAGYTWVNDETPTWDATNRRVKTGSQLLKPDGTPITQRERLLTDGTTKTINTPFELLTPSNGYDPLRATAGIVIERWLNDFGIPTNANLIGFNELKGKVFSGTNTAGDPLRNFDMWILGWGLTPFPTYLTSFFAQANAGPDGNNAGNFNSPRYEKLVADFEQADTFAKEQMIVFEMQDILATELPYLTLFTTNVYDVYRTNQVEFAYTDVFDGVQNLFQSFYGALATSLVVN